MQLESVDGAEWTEKHGKEHTFQQAKQLKHLINAVLDGSKPAGQCSRELLEAVLAEAQRRAKVRKQHLATTKRRELALQRPTAISISGLAVFVSPNTDIDVEHVRSACKQAGCSLVEDRTQADVFVVPNPSAMGSASSWACGMRGGVVASAEFFASNGTHGVMLKMKPYAAKRRTVHCTDAFRQSHPEVFNVLRITSRQGRRKGWLWLDSLEQVNQAKARFTSADRQAELMVFASSAEVQNRPAALGGIKYVLNEKMGRLLILEVDKACSRLGMCGH